MLSMQRTNSEVSVSIMRAVVTSTDSIIAIAGPEISMEISGPHLIPAG
jgi:hypothetical protein